MAELMEEGRCYFIGALQQAFKDEPQDKRATAARKVWARGVVKQCLNMARAWEKGNAANERTLPAGEKL